MAENLPAPPVPAGVDLRSFRFMPLDVVTLHSSETWGMADGWQAKALINLWTRAWHQVPAGSLPDNPELLRAWAGVPDWERCMSIALRGFTKCSDGRLYHLKLCERVMEAWEQKERYRRAGKARWKKGKQAGAEHGAMHEHSSENAYASAQLGRGRGNDESPSGFSREKPEGGLANDEADLFRRGKAVLGKDAGGLIAKLRKAKGGSVPLARAAIETAATKENPREYIGALIRGANAEEEGARRNVDSRL